MAESLAGGGLASENGAALAKRMGPVSDMDRREHRAVFEKFGTRGIVEQAEKGFPAARQAEAMLLRDGTDLLAPFLAIAAGTSDAHLLLRGGLEAQLYVRTEMKRRATGWSASPLNPRRRCGRGWPRSWTGC